MKFRKKPVVVEAVQYESHGNFSERMPDWLRSAFPDVLRCTNGDDPLLIKTLEGELTVSPGDWIIRGVKGELYPIKPDILAVTYEAVDEKSA